MVTLSGKFVYEDNTPVANGILVLTLSQQCNISGTAQIAPLRKVIQLDATGSIPGGTTVYGNDALTPAGTTYVAVLYSGLLNTATGLYTIGAMLAPPQNWSLTGSSVDVSTLTPTTNGASYVSPVTSIGLTMPGEFTVSNSPVTTAGTIIVSKANQSANLVYAGPTTGAAAAPTFRALVDADIPGSLSAAGTLTNKTINANNNTFQNLIATVTLKKGSGAGAYTTTSITYVDVDATNLSLTVTIPTGWKLVVAASGFGFIGTASDSFFVSLFDSATLVETAATPSSTTQNFPWALNYVINGDGLSHTVKLQFKTATNTHSANIANSSSVQLPTMVFQLVKSN